MGKLMQCSLLAVILAAPALAQPMHRCVGKHGEPTFSDKRCSDPSMTQRRPQARPPGSVPADAYQTCLRRPEELRDALTAALQLDQRVRLSGLLLWSSGMAGQGLQRLYGLAGGTVHDLQLELDDDGQPAIVIHSTAYPRGVPRATQAVFHLRAHRGCWWLTGG